MSPFSVHQDKNMNELTRAWDGNLDYQLACISFTRVIKIFGTAGDA